MRASLVAACLSTLIATGAVTAQAGGLRARTVAAAATAQPDCAVPADCGAAAPACAPACQPNIIYRSRGHAQTCCGCPTPIQTVLVVKDPCGCQTVEVPVCVPGCCTDVPQVCNQTGLFGRGVVRYDYACGFSVKVVFRHNGDIVVTYFS